MLLPPVGSPESRFATGRYTAGGESLAEGYRAQQAARAEEQAKRAEEAAERERREAAKLAAAVGEPCLRAEPRYCVSCRGQRP